MFESHFFSPSSAERDRGWGGCALTIGTVTRVTGRVGGAAAGLGISHANGLPMMRSLAWLALLATSPALATELAATPQLPYTLPATMEHHRFFVDAQAPGGQTLRLFTDTGGGMNLTTRGADKLGLAYDKENNLGSEHEPVFGTTTWPTYASPWIPPPKAADVRLAIMPGPDWMHDGMLGTKWFGDRTWEWDYRAGTLRLLPTVRCRRPIRRRSEEHTSELQSLMRISYAVFCLKKKK